MKGEPHMVVQLGFCHCGRGSKTRIPTVSDASHGYMSGVPLAYIRGHHTGKPQGWVEVDTG